MITVFRFTTDLILIQHIKDIFSSHSSHSCTKATIILYFMMLVPAVFVKKAILYET